jgi:hypothetical protein
VAKLRAALVKEANEDDDAAGELGPLGEANKALKAGDESGFMGAMKKLRTKAWSVVQTLGLTYLDHYVGRSWACRPPAGPSNLGPRVSAAGCRRALRPVRLPR